MRKGIGPNSLGAPKGVGKMMGSPAKQVSAYDLKSKSVKEEKKTSAMAAQDEMREKRARKAEASGDEGRARRIRSTMNTQSNNPA